jgi:hypothetical protein
MANNAFQCSRLAFIGAKMNARSRLNVVADFRANPVRSVVDQAAFKRLVPVEHGKSQRQAVRVSGIPASFLRWGHNPQAIDSTIGKIRSDHGASPWFKERQVPLLECSCPPTAFAKDMPCRLKVALKGILDMISLGWKRQTDEGGREINLGTGLLLQSARLMTFYEFIKTTCGGCARRFPARRSAGP